MKLVHTARVYRLTDGAVKTFYGLYAMADFLLADNNKTVLIESKGSFTLKDNDPIVIKSVLKGALKG